MRTPKIAAVATAVPRYRWDQAALLWLSGYDGQRANFFANSDIESRYLYLDPETFTVGNWLRSNHTESVLPLPAQIVGTVSLTF